VSTGNDSKPHIVRMWAPRQGRFVWGVLPPVMQGFQREPTQKQREDTRKAYAWRNAQDKKGNV